MPLSIDDAIALIVEAVKTAPAPGSANAANARPYWCDVLIPNVLRDWWFREYGRSSPMPDPGELDYAPFYDAAWELCRRGILRVGAAFPMGQRSHSEPADGYSLTSFGRTWIESFDHQVPFPTDPGRFAALISRYANRFGLGFIQRSNEAAGCYRTLNYFACCAMCGAAAESILLAVAIAKSGDEERILSQYRASSGRRRVIDFVAGTAPASVATSFRSALSLLTYWRDDAAHGTASDISELEAHDALSRLLRFAQFVDGAWPALTGSA